MLSDSMNGEFCEEKGEVSQSTSSVSSVTAISSWWFSGFLFISDKVAISLFARNFAPLMKASFVFILFLGVRQR